MQNKSLIFLLLSIVLFIFADCANKNPKILISTEFGDIVAELYIKEAPVTTENFLRYVKEDRLKDAVFYRSVTMANQPDDSIKIQVLQGGLDDDEHPDTLPPIQHETTVKTGILHKDGVLSMARWKPGTATNHFFICVGDQPELDFGGRRNPDGQGFAAFGRVIQGMDVVRKIHALPVEGQMLKPPVKMLKVRLVE